MSPTENIWIHEASYTFSHLPPSKLIETLWVYRQGWGYLKRRDLWILKTVLLENLLNKGFQEIMPINNETVTRCPSCNLYMENIPGYLSRKHGAQCFGNANTWTAIEERMINNIRLERHERAILEKELREKAEQEERERRERHEKIREQYFANQLSKDRKKRLKQEARDTLRNK